ncbi:HAMP domain-containing protein [Mesorhizobium sp. M7A.T.Ca.TU.009.01.3.2]|uniref:ATP-binding protein n=1 Tax=unclassified Mesorhizobium TaxID=325217 RepID=UPI000FCC1CA1|nr:MULTISPECIES: ATP-binding protein [unclassified Mesorhizobium]MCQ8873216.1 ATP-binding protein [Mesorhizobium sp. LMG17149]RUU12828.1 HAMP domain-containing protein [Mesorhizobium sp. M7A.T.Ca.TU.009.01.3.2]RUV08919.1 HAMP domain-containing protein [Mesorhizobium sp. M7A.T.Ca.TU.009.01.3.1]RUV21301.1 HAMP domain-containing protein [Mesorhizobium sp. M7A.F.Ca.MR.245.00.0.0]RWQ14665.1 MAG: HAMP domain-containing protein [Mesorhizobium sp.]
MNSLRRRLILLLVASIVGVVGLATAAVISVRGGGPPPELTVPWIAQQMELVVRLLPGPVPDVLRVQFADHPAGGKMARAETAMLNDILHRRGLDFPAVVNEKADEPGQIASMHLPDNRWAIMEMPHLKPPRREWLVLAGWISLIVAGATAVSVYFTSVLIRPLEMLEAAVSKIGSDGVLAAVPEVGSAEVKATAHALNQLSSRLRTAMESRMRLVAAAGHDLRTPMTRMRLRAEFLDDERDKWLHDLDELDRIADSAIRLVREEVNQDAVEAVDLAKTVRDIEAEMASLGHAVSIGHLDKVCVRAGALGLRRALRNLIVNAATHGKACRIDLAAADNRAVLTISDHGPGIPTELLNKAFEPFFRVNPGRLQSVPGAGLGLAIAKEIIERYGGTVTLENRRGGGLEQTVVFDAV